MLHRQLNDPTKVKTWTDFTKVLLHDKAVFPLLGVWPGLSPFDGFTHGLEVLTAEDREEVLDRTRCLVEACDSPQVCPPPHASNIRSIAPCTPWLLKSRSMLAGMTDSSRKPCKHALRKIPDGNLPVKAASYALLECSSMPHATMKGGESPSALKLMGGNAGHPDPCG